MEKHWTDELETLDLSDKKHSQFGEPLIVEYILDHAFQTYLFFLVDIGAGGAGRELSNSRYFLEKGWQGLLFDMDGSEGTIKEFITPFNIVELLKKNDCPKEFDFLNLDIDSFDYDVLEAILKEYTPRVVCAEFNGTLDPESKVKLAYEEGYTWDGSNKYGFSLGAGIDLFEKYGYKVVLNQQETNIFAVRKEYLPKGFNKVIKGVKTPYHWTNTKCKWINL